MQKDIHILEFPTNLGLKAPQPGKELGVKRLRSWLQQYGFHDLLQPVKIHHLEPPQYAMDWDEVAGVNNADAIIRYAQQQAALLKPVLEKSVFPVILGGDCSMLIGNALACKQAGEFGLWHIQKPVAWKSPFWIPIWTLMENILQNL